MAIFAVLHTEKLVQVGDKTRLDARQSFLSPAGSITKLEIKPSDSADYIDCTDEKVLDWLYSEAGDVTASVRVTVGDEEGVGTSEFAVISAVNDALFSSDSELLPLEPGILNFVPAGRASFLNVHREAQTIIMDKLHRKGINDHLGNRLEKTAILDRREVSEWSKYLTLQLIFEGMSNQVGDVFSQKAEKYKSFANQAENKATLALDLNVNGQIDDEEKKTSTSWVPTVRR